MNRNLTVGLFLLIVLLLLAFLGPIIAPFHTDYAESIRKVDNIYESGPFPPDGYHFLGTDLNGFDIASLLLFGCRYTVLFCIGTALGRILIGTLAAMSAGQHKLPEIKILQGFAAIPTLVIVYFILVNINFNCPLKPVYLALIQSAVIIIVGIPGNFTAMQERILALKKSPHVDAAESCGAGHSHIMKQHILPFLVEPLLLNFTRETISVLILIGQLGILNVFIGGTKILPWPMVFLSKTYEWAGLLGFYREYIISSNSWITLSPLIVYLLFLTALYLCANGLEIFFSKMYKRISFL